MMTLAIIGAVMATTRMMTGMVVVVMDMMIVLMLWSMLMLRLMMVPSARAHMIITYCYVYF